MSLTQLTTGSLEQRTVVNAIAVAVDALGATGNVGTADIADDAVTTAKILDANVTTAKILNANVTTAKLATDAVTGIKIASTALKYLAFTGKNGAGAITLTGAAVGDKVAGVANTTDGGSGASLFESTVTVINQIQQSSASDLSTKKYTVLLITGT